MEQADLARKPHRVVFYTKAGCHLCDEARDLLEELAEEMITFELTETDIRTDMALFEKYRYRIPVIIIDEQATVEGRISLAELRRAFSTRQERL
jgi:glutaredoxin